MYQLVLDTSNQYLYVALAKDFRVFTSILQVGNNNHSETLMDVVKKIMSDNSLTTKDLESIIVGRGPGSYTGVRVACTIAKVMAYLENIKLYSFSSLDLLLSKYLDENNTYIIHMDARRGYAYLKTIKLDNGNITILTDETFSTLEEEKNKFPEALCVNQNVNDSDDYNIYNLYKYDLIKEETNIHDFEPTYLRSGV